MVACTYGISLLVFNSTSHSWAIELNTQREIPHLHALVYYSLHSWFDIASPSIERSLIIVRSQIDLSQSSRTAGLSRTMFTFVRVFSVLDSMLFALSDLGSATTRSINPPLLNHKRILCQLRLCFSTYPHACALARRRCVNKRPH